MIKSLSIARRVYRPEDFQAVSDFFGAIGFEVHEATDSSSFFVAPLAKLYVASLPKKHSPQFRELAKDYDRLFFVEVTDPETVWFIAHKCGYKIVRDSISKKTGEHTFAVELPGGILLDVRGLPDQAPPGVEGSLRATGKRFAIVVSRFNEFITERLLQGALSGLFRTGAERKNLDIVRVPGAFEIPSAARTLAETKKYDAIICLGCLLRGDSAHYDVIVNEVTRGIGQSAQETGVPHAFGVLTCDTLEQAIDRAGLKMGNKGFEAALAAVEMANLKKAVVGRSSLAGGKSNTKTNRRSGWTSNKKSK